MHKIFSLTSVFIFYIIFSFSWIYAQYENIDIATGISNSSISKLAQLEKVMEENTLDNKSTDSDIQIQDTKDVIIWKNHTSHGKEFEIEYLSNWNVNNYAQFIQSPDAMEQFSYAISYPEYSNIDVLTRISVLDDLKSSDIHILRSLLSNLDFNTSVDGERAGSYSYGEKDDRFTMLNAKGYDMIIFHKFLTLHDGKLYKFTFKDITYETIQRMVDSIRWIN